MDSSDTKNFLRFLTLQMSSSIEDPLVRPLLQPLSFGQIQQYARSFRAERYPVLSPRKFSLYLHVPYCFPLCSYCHCDRIELTCRQELKDYVEFLIKQINLFAPLFKNIPVTHFTILGGTASLLSTDDMRRVLAETFSKFDMRSVHLASFEGKPASLTKPKQKILKEYGFKHLSIGVQSMDPVVLKEINRRQTPVEVRRCIESAKQLGFSCVNADIVAGLPWQSVQSFIRDIDTLTALKTDLIHIFPFSDWDMVRYYKNKTSDPVAVIRLRDEIIVAGKKAIESAGYVQEGLDGYRLKSAAKLYADQGSHLYPGSVLGLGMFARSHLSGEVVFDIVPYGKNITKAGFVGYEIDMRYTMAQYAGLHAVNEGLDPAAFRKIFGVDLNRKFSLELDWLMNEGVIKDVQGVYRYGRPWDIVNLFDHFALTKIFLGEDMLGQMRKHFVREYDPRKDYSAQKHFTKICQDLWRMRTYYRLGYKSCWF